MTGQPHLCTGLKIISPAHADRVIINSYVGARQAEARGIPASRIIVIPNGIDTEKFGPSVESRQAKRTALGYTPDDIVIGMVGRLDPVKDHGRFYSGSKSTGQRKQSPAFFDRG